jgi:hypothetical protein
MRSRTLRSLGALIGLVLLSASPRAQTAATAAPAATTAAGCALKQWTANKPAIEQYLRSAEIDRMENLPVGVTKPKKAFLKSGGPVAAIAWKDLQPGMHNGFWDSYKAEIAAYELDKLLGMDMVPPAVEKRVKGSRGAAVQWVDNTHPWKISEPIKGPDPVAWEKQVIRMKMFDNLICNKDRNQGNLLYDDDYHLILIDHSRAFINSKDLPTKMSRIDREFLDKLNALTLDQLNTALGPWLGKSEIKAILERRDRMNAEIDKMVAERGEAVVFVK